VVTTSNINNALLTEARATYWSRYKRSENCQRIHNAWPERWRLH